MTQMRKIIEDSNMTLVLILCFALTIFYLTKIKYSYWTSRGITQLNPYPILGDMKLNISLRTQYMDFYKKFKEKGVQHGGIYFFVIPVYMAMDLEVIKCILVKNFECFRNRGHTAVDKKKDPLSANLFNLEDDQWRAARSIVSPGFTPGKLKKTFQCIFECTHDLVDVFQRHKVNCEPIYIEEYAKCYTMDSAGSYFFGVNCNCLKNPDAEFKIHGERVFQYSFARKLRMVIAKCTPHWCQRIYKLDKIDSESEKFFIRFVKETLKYREENNVNRSDMMQSLIELKNAGKFRSEYTNGTIVNNNFNEITSKENEVSAICAHCFSFFIAGAELSSTTIDFALFEIAENQEIQRKIRKEVVSVLSRNENEFTYESVAEMTYLECVLKEVLRKYPPVPVLIRKCNTDFQVPGSDFVIKKGNTVHIPVIALHFDPEYYPDPERFDPSRFLEEKSEKRPYFPFGDGPRGCVGMRLGFLQVKIALATVIKSYEVRVNSKTITPFQWNPHGLVPTVKGGVWLDVNEIES